MSVNPYRFAEFIAAYNDGSITQDTAWRSYDIEHMATLAKARKAAHSLGFKEGTYNDFAACAAKYYLGTAERAKHLLSLWWAWSLIARGRNARGAKLRRTDNA